jgi:fructose transport system ATP-binding protein
VDPEGEGVMAVATETPILEARGLVKRYGHVTALAGSDFDLMPGEILAVIGDNGAGKSSLIKCLSGAVVPDDGEILLEGQPINMKTPIDARGYGIETVYQTLAVSPSLDIADNLFLGREPRAPGILGSVFRKLDRAKMRAEAKKQMTELGIMTTTTAPVIFQARGLVKRYGHVTALDGVDFDLRAGEILAVIGDNGAGKSSLIKALSGATIPDEGEIRLDDAPVHFGSPVDARRHGIETVYQDLAVAPAMSIAENLFLGREILRPGIAGKVFRMVDKKKMLSEATRYMQDLKVGIRSMVQAVETLSGGQRQCVAVSRAAAFAKHVVILDEPTAALGVKEGNMVLEMIRRVRDRGLSVILISHNMPHVFEIADRIHIQRLGRRAAVVNPKHISMSDTVAVMTGAMTAEQLPEEAHA